MAQEPPNCIIIRNVSEKEIAYLHRCGYLKSDDTNNNSRVISWIFPKDTLLIKKYRMESSEKIIDLDKQNNELTPIERRRENGRIRTQKWRDKIKAAKAVQAAAEALINLANMK